jgi:hypothetical protein
VIFVGGIITTQANITQNNYKRSLNRENQTKNPLDGSNLKRENNQCMYKMMNQKKNLLME